ncbi:Adaptin [Spironucleus salmonicida]|uniref:Adaptin n=1 Tax=Spironucleus salmonicida TaxID=348837 RepID=V6LR53_9EUKA|nr:Adaptin [Spironucleus salmonicida]|eukprot:EST46161.1 Adaptin [Spironucleus salmonicida]
MINQIFIINQKAQPIAFRQYSDQPNNISINIFKNRVIYQSNDVTDCLPPVFEENGIIYAYIEQSELYYVATSFQDSNAFIMIEFLNQLYKLFKSYFDEVDETALKDNITLVYELLDEVVDNGIPQVMEPDVLKSFICQRSILEKIVDAFKIKDQKSKQITAAPPAVTGLVSWRKENIIYKKNQAFLDVTEILDVNQTAEGKVLSSSIKGIFKMKSLLSGMPNLKLGLNDKVKFDAVLGQQSQQSAQDEIELEDIKLHQCVKLSKFSEEKTISFIPPDGEFDLLSYRLSKQQQITLLNCQVKELKTNTGFSYLVTLSTKFPKDTVAQRIVVSIPVHQNADTPVFKPSLGKAVYVPGNDTIEWTLQNVSGMESIILTAEFGLPSCRVQSEDQMLYSQKPITIKFEINQFSLSQINVRYLKIHDKTGYKASPWVRYLSSGNIVIKR